MYYTNDTIYIDSLAVNINDISTLSTDVIYFDFAKAFDSVNRDVILHKLKYQFDINGLLLKFLVNYLEGREQAVVIGGANRAPAQSPLVFRKVQFLVHYFFIIY